MPNTGPSRRSRASVKASSRPSQPSDQDLQRGPSPPPARLTTVRCLLGRYTLTVPTARDGSAPLAGGARDGSMEPRTLSRRAEAGPGRRHGAPRTQEGFRGPVMTVWKQSGRDKKKIQSPGSTSPRHLISTQQPKGSGETPRTHPVPPLLSLARCLSRSRVHCLGLGVERRGSKDTMRGSTLCPGEHGSTKSLCWGLTSKSNHTAVGRVRYIMDVNRLSWLFNGERVVARYCGGRDVTDRMVGNKQKIRYSP